MSNSAEIIGKRLYQEGCRRAFGIPGGEALDLMEGLKNSGIDFFLTKQKTVPVSWRKVDIMRMGSSNSAGTLGPGVANAVNVVTNAFRTESLCFSYRLVDASDKLTYTHQVFNHGNS
ncbi:MAG: hypothetical protein CM1200mP28_14260 [Deltaproteobacteria bacterium]|nr:MAG: hypothetical protein CM1200mP28_14260 [Deltaproteobacteria bacterium]